MTRPAIGPAGAGRPTGPVGSVIVPAHNEAAVIGRCLDALLAGARPGEFDVVVVCNGCTDGTAAQARAGGRPVRVLDLPAPSKVAAIRAGEAATDVFPRLFLDADVVLPADSARQVFARLLAGPALAARAPIHYDTAHSSAAVRRYYRARARLPAVMNSLWGAGMYGLSAAGRARFGEFPDVVADDLFVDQHFAPGEIEIVPCAPVVVTGPRRLGGLLRVLRRVQRGRAETTDQPTGAGPPPATTGATVSDLLRLAWSGPAAAVDAAAYAAVAVVARLAVAVAAAPRWERDDSSRAR